MDPSTLILTLVLGFLLAYRYLWKPMTRFKELNVPHETPIPIIGNMAPTVFRKVSMHECLQNLYHRFPNVKYFGVYHFVTPVIAIREPELITSIAVKNFDNFTDHVSVVDEKMDPLVGNGLFFLRGDAWREMRKILSPSFTASKLKAMFHLINDCADKFTRFVADDARQGRVYEMKEIFGRYTNDAVASCNFGFVTDSMRDPGNEFYTFAKRTMNFLSSLSLRLILGNNFPSLFKLLRIRMFDDSARQYFISVVDNVVKARKENGIHRPDVIQMMMEHQDADGKCLTIEEMTYQAFVFYMASYDTVSSILSFAAHEIAVHPEIQAKLYREIEEVVAKTNGKPTYEALKNMQYMNGVINEVLRLYAVIPFLDRVCVKEFQLPPATPEGQPVTVKPGDIVWFLSFALQRDSEHFPDPLRFDPDRCLSPIESSQATYIPFGLGPRLCVGNRFALLMCRVMLFHLLWRCELQPCEKTSIPMKFNSKSFVLMAKEGCWLKFRARDMKMNFEDNKMANGAN
ncbi:unnamed protein product [Heterotrigona itama]|uniref:Cytochrome P450 n=1 Tax=Heterotrigona itama TaxID=395501 RepID=A0A6V7GWV2_9HYME|nr:unnamed protein product [Heterotrigona itama]